MPPAELPPGVLHPLLQDWFTENFGEPTAVQREAWIRIAEKKHVLALAPTGSGKTLAAFLVAISRFAQGLYNPEELCVLYVSPLKALNEDIRRNLLAPLESLAARFAREGAAFPVIRVDTRSGDTPQAERRRFLSRPPGILALTPESLAILLLNPRARAALEKVRYVVLDEVHAVLGSKRGSFLACQIERLAMTAGEFQRIALSATVRPPEEAAFFTGGLRRLAGGGRERRPVCVVAPPAHKRISLAVEYPDVSAEAQAVPVCPEGREGRRPASPRYLAVIHAIAERIGRNRSTLVFTDSRRRAERLAGLLNEHFGKTVAFAHHGSLSKELRHTVETHLAGGSLPCVVATSSLELGIDIGEVDEVILAGACAAAATALQRIGRSGHGVGRTSRALVLPFHGLDLLAGAALALAVADREIEESRNRENPLDVLAQLVLCLCAEKSRNAGELYGLIKGFLPFENLPRASYERVLRMLAGRCGDRRLRELKARLYFDERTGELSAPAGLLRLLYTRGGVIANRGGYSLRLAGGTKIGELDEEFVWERRPGDRFSFGTRSWRITAITSEAVEAVPLESDAAYVPFWKAEGVFRSPVLTRRILEILEAASAQEGLPPGLTGACTPAAQEALRLFLGSQLAAQGGLPLPSKRSIAVEITSGPYEGEENRAFAERRNGEAGGLVFLIFHTFRGGAVNHPFALALAQYLEEALALRVEASADDNAVLMTLPRLAEPETESLIRKALAALAADGPRHRYFRARLESSGTFGAAFREAAEVSLILPRPGFAKRTPLWVSRQRAKRLFDAVSAFEDFPLTAEAWRYCLADKFDMAGFDEFFDGIRDGVIAVNFFAAPAPSPFSRGILWRETNRFMYEYDERPDLRGAAGASLSDAVIEEALGEARKRPPLAAALVADFTRRLRRELPGWTPEDETGLAEWVRERAAIPRDEWECLLQALGEGLRARLEAAAGLDGRIKELRAAGARLCCLVHRENAEIWETRPLSLLAQWLRYEGPVSEERIAEVFGGSPAGIRAALQGLADEGEIVLHVALAQEADAEEGRAVCDRQNLEILLRLSRKKRRPQIKPLPATHLVPYLARRQNILSAPGVRGRPWQSLACYAEAAGLWETEIFPARAAAEDPYRPEALDAELEAGSLVWFGAGRGRCGFCAPEDLDLVLPRRGGGPFFGESSSPLDFWQIKDACGLDMDSCIRAVWKDAWAGRISSTDWQPVRKLLAAKSPPAPERRESGRGEIPSRESGVPGVSRRRIPRALRERWKQGAPLAGRWFSLAADEAFYDPLEQEELERDRVRLLVRRWGVLCRPLLEREAPELSWGKLLPAIRRLELAGELVAGRFFEGIASLQFASPAIAGELEEAASETGVYWLSARDPASPSGLDVQGLDARLPPRLPANRLCFRGADLLAVSRRGGKSLSLYLPPQDADLGRVLEGFAARPSGERRRITVETINGQSAAASPYAEALKSMGFMAEWKRLVLW
jgi:ATP-dependent Lhr-like helicase